MRRLLATIIALLTVLVASQALGAEPPRPSEPRALPDYDGRGKRPTTADDIGRWAPRALLFPPYVVVEYGVRRPLGWFVSTAERKKWHVALYNFFTTADHKSGLVPTALFDFGFKPSVGLYGFADDFVAKRNDLRVQFGTWGPSWLHLAATDRVRLSDESTIAAVANFVRRPDQIFHGLGPRSLGSDRARYSIRQSDVGLEYTVLLGGWNFFRARAGYRRTSFEGDGCCGDPSLDERIAEGRLSAPPGFEGYANAYESVLLTLDSRKKRPASQSGLRLEVAAEDAQEPRANGRNWVRWGAIGGAYLDVGRGRALALKTTVRFSDPLRGGDVPFTEQVSLGGARAMRGYLPGRLIGRSALVAELEYRWPVWVWLDGTIHVALGNVFGAHLEDFHPKLLRLSSGIGFRSNGTPDQSFEFLAGFGTETIADGLRVTSFRLLFGTTRGF